MGKDNFAFTIILSLLFVAIIMLVIFSAIKPEPINLEKEDESFYSVEITQDFDKIEHPGYIESDGNVIIVDENGDFQKALDDANPGDIIELKAGAYYEGSFIFPKKDGDEWITIRTSEFENLPEGRVTLKNRNLMPKIAAPPYGPAIKLESGAHNYKIVGLEIMPQDRTYSYGLIVLGENEINEDNLPYNIIIDKSYIHGDSVLGSKRGIALNSKSTSISNSHISDFKSSFQEAQGIAGWNGPGPYKIINNYIEGSTQNVLFGGASPAIKDLVPTNIEILNNHFAKPEKWNKDSPNYDGSSWMVKNIFELKNARNVVIKNNIFENNWVDAQNGYGILFTPRNQDRTSPWVVVENVEFSNNIIRNSHAGVNILGIDDNSPSEQTNRITIKDNLFIDVGDLFLIIGPTDGIIIDHNTALNSGNVITADLGVNDNFVFKNNIIKHNQYGIFGSNYGSGDKAIQKYFPNSKIDNNVFISSENFKEIYSGNNFFVTEEEIKFDEKYVLKTDSNFKNSGTDGKDLGADISLICNILGC